MRKKLLLLSLLLIGLFTWFSYTVAKEAWVQFDFDTTVKLQDRINKKFDKYFSYFSILGSAEVTVVFCAVMALWSLVRLRWLATLGWSMIIPATAAEVFGKLVLFHPAPQVFLNRTSVFTKLPSFYVHTDYSYPSGHLTRTIFIAAVLLVVFYQSKNPLIKYIGILSVLVFSLLMGLTRVSLGEHWTTDVIGGALLGAGMGFLASVLILRHKKD